MRSATMGCQWSRFSMPHRSLTHRSSAKGNEWELHPEVAARPHDVLIHKSLPGSFTDTELETWLRERGVETVVIAGYMTQMCRRVTAHLGHIAGTPGNAPRFWSGVSFRRNRRTGSQ